MVPLLGGKYRVTGTIGHGGMAVVHAGLHLKTDRAVAIKRLLPRYAADAAMVARFEREARAAGRIDSEHVVEVLDIDHDEEGPYLVMERLQGESLASRLFRVGRLPPHETVAILEQVLRGLTAAHEAGVIHRDLKPGNVFVSEAATRQLVVKLVDFGISKIVDREREELTTTGEMLGTVAYLAPEQIRSRKATPRSDLWAAAVVLYRCLSGRHPFQADDDLTLLARVLERPPDPLPPELGNEITRGFGPFFDRALAKDPRQRYSSASEMALALRGLSLGHPGAALDLRGLEPSTLAPLHAPVFAPRPPPTAEGVSRVDRLRRAAPSALVVAVAAITGLVVGTASGGRGAAIVTIDVEPGDARLVMADVPLEERRVAVFEGRPHTLTVSANGYLTRNVELPTRTSLVHVELERLPPNVPVASSAVPAHDPPAPEPAVAEDPAEQEPLFEVVETSGPTTPKKAHAAASSRGAQRRATHAIAKPQF